MKWVRNLLFLAGAGLFVALILHQGLDDVGAAFVVMGWGLAAVVAFRAVPLICNGWGWNLLLDPPRRRPLAAMAMLSWIAESINNLLPVARVGGDLVRARLLARLVQPPAYAAGTVVVDFTLGLLGQLVFVLAGVCLLFLRDASGQASAFVVPLAVASAAILAFALLQQRGLFDWLARIAARMLSGERWQGFLSSLQSLDQHVKQLYRDRAALVRCFVVRLAGWFLGVGETWLALYYLNLSPTVADAVVLESLAYAARSFAFLLPGALGVQEAVLMVAAAFTGLTAEAGLMVSLAKRVREVILGVPGLVVWGLREPGFRSQVDSAE